MIYLFKQALYVPELSLAICTPKWRHNEHMKVCKATPSKFGRTGGPAIAGGGGRMMLELHSALILFMGKGEEETALPVRQSFPLPSRAVAVLWA